MMKNRQILLLVILLENTKRPAVVNFVKTSLVGSCEIKRDNIELPQTIRVAEGDHKLRLLPRIWPSGPSQHTIYTFSWMHFSDAIITFLYSSRCIIATAKTGSFSGGGQKYKRLTKNAHHSRAKKYATLSRCAQITIVLRLIKSTFRQANGSDEHYSTCWTKKTTKPHFWEKKDAKYISRNVTPSATFFTGEPT